MSTCNTDLTSIDNRDVRFTLTRPRSGVTATAVSCGVEFTVLAGSRANARVGALLESYRDRRLALVADGTLVPAPDNPAHLVFMADTSFANASMAASIVAGAQMNGYAEWEGEGGAKVPRATKPKRFDTRRRSLARALAKLADDLKDLDDAAAKVFEERLRALADDVARDAPEPRRRRRSVEEIAERAVRPAADLASLQVALRIGGVTGKVDISQLGEEWKLRALPGTGSADVREVLVRIEGIYSNVLIRGPAGKV